MHNFYCYYPSQEGACYTRELISLVMTNEAGVHRKGLFTALAQPQLLADSLER